MQTAGMHYLYLADGVLLVHAGIVVFVVGGLAVILVGNLLAWSSVNHLRFRLAHLAAIAFVVAESWIGITCPLTRLESWLRVQAGEAAYHVGFIEYWFHRVLFHEAPSWVFASVYTVFGVLVAAAWWYFPPQWRNQHNRNR